MIIDNKYPICDTDIWIKNAKHIKFFLADLIFKKYGKIYMSDAVRQEIGRERNDDRRCDFEIGLEAYQQSYADKLIMMIKLNDSKIFSKEMQDTIERELFKYKIFYDKNSGKYTSTVRDTGETVTVIFAAMLNIPLVLCDEEKADSIVKRYKQLDVRNLIDLLKQKYGADIKTLEEIRHKLSTPIGSNPNMFKRIKEDSKGASRLAKFKSKYVI